MVYLYLKSFAGKNQDSRFFRLRKYLNGWTDKKIIEGFDLITIAGGVKNYSFVLNQIEISVKLHGIKEAFLINHEDCGAYGKMGTYKKHQEDLLSAKKMINKKFQKLKIRLFYLKLDGEFVKVD